jgi:4-amino-4-deoxy-L-arabinose transferase-like glycosyltransferase
VAAAFVALFPLFFEHSIVSYSEPISALFLVLAFWAYLRDRTALTVVLGTLAALCKINVAPVYCGAIGLSLLYRLWKRSGRAKIARSLIALTLPLLVLVAWRLAVAGDRALTTGSPLELWLFKQQLGEMLQMLFYIPWYGALLTLAVIGFCTVYGAHSSRIDGEARLVLVGWIVFGLVGLLIYMATPRSGNSPRVMLFSLPPIALLFAEGLRRLPREWMRRVGFYVAALFLIINGFIIYYGVETVRYNRTFTDVWGVLRSQPRGFVLTNAYWMTTWTTGQPVTWFEWDEDFQRNILHNRDHFARYISQNPIRYVVVPRPNTPAAVSNPLIQVETSRLYGDDVLAYLGEHAQRIPVPPYYDLYVLPKPDNCARCE